VREEAADGVAVAVGVGGCTRAREESPGSALPNPLILGSGCTRAREEVLLLLFSGGS
jgi:hypothetical protein